ncbi:unnamed protein product, partial [Ectocarpus sp. 12 AP-2014]
DTLLLSACPGISDRLDAPLVCYWINSSAGSAFPGQVDAITKQLQTIPAASRYNNSSLRLSSHLASFVPQEERQRPGTNKSTGPSTLQATTARSPHLGGEDSGPPPLRSGDDPAAEEAPNRATEIVMDPTLPSLLPRTAPPAPDHSAAQHSTRNGLSKGSGITSQHIRWVTELRSARGRWSSEVQGPWTHTEDAYFEFVYELFREGLLEGIEVGLPLRFFMSELLGCEVKRVDQRLLATRRSPELGCPKYSTRQLTGFEQQSLTAKLVKLEQSFLARERNPLNERVVFEASEEARRRGSARASDARAPPGTAARAAYVDPRTPLSASLPAAWGTAAVPPGGGGATTQPNGRAASGGAGVANESNGIPGHPSSAPPAASAPSPAVGGSTSSSSSSSSDPNHPGRRRPPTLTSGSQPGAQESAPAPPVPRGLLAEALAGPGPATPAAAPAPDPLAGSMGRELGQRLLGVARNASSGSWVEEPARQKQKTTATTVPSSQMYSSSSYSAAAAAAVGSASATATASTVAAAESRPNEATSWDGEVQETREDLAAMEYLKWELHGKFMAFPGEHYHNLLANLASEIYHNRYPVEHGIDILHGVMR